MECLWSQHQKTTWTLATWTNVGLGTFKMAKSEKYEAEGLIDFCFSVGWYSKFMILLEAMK